MEIEAACGPGTGRVLVTGIVEEEEMGGGGHTMKRKSTARASAENVATLLRCLGYLDGSTDVHINFPGGMPVDGPSAGTAMALAAVSALTGRPVDGSAAVTGEIGVQGRVLPVGGVPEKVEAARRAGLNRVLIPKDNGMERFENAGIQVVLIEHVQDALRQMLLTPAQRGPSADSSALPDAALAAAPLAAKG